MGYFLVNVHYNESHHHIIQPTESHQKDAIKPKSTSFINSSQGS